MADLSVEVPASLTVRRLVPAPRERVFAAWTTPEGLKQWSAPGDRTNPVVEVDLRVGGRYRLDMAAPNGATHRVVGTYVEIEPPRRLVYTWFWETNPTLGEMLITVEFLVKGEHTEVVLVHSKLPSADAVVNHERGWVGCLDKLESLFTT